MPAALAACCTAHCTPRWGSDCQNHRPCGPRLAVEQERLGVLRFQVAPRTPSAEQLAQGTYRSFRPLPLRTCKSRRSRVQVFDVDAAHLHTPQAAAVEQTDEQPMFEQRRGPQQSPHLLPARITGSFFSCLMLGRVNRL